MRILKVLCDDTQHTPPLPPAAETKTLYYFGEPFDTSGIVFLSDWADAIVVDDRIYTQVAPALEQPPWPLSLLGQALEQGGPGPMDFVPSVAPVKPIPKTFPGTVLFVPSNDTHVKILHPIAERIPNHHYMVVREERADLYLGRLGEKFWWYRPVWQRHRPLASLKAQVKHWLTWLSRLGDQSEYATLDQLQPSMVVLGNDWGPQERDLCDQARKLAIPSVCIQEGPQDFELGLGQMQNADHILVQGAITTKYLDRKQFIITGNPRLSNLPKAPLPEKPMVMINANFTYGVYEALRDRWMEAVVEACRGAGLDFFVSRHPRDRGEYRGLPVIDSDAFKLHDQIAKSSLLVTRFSQVLYEAVLMGRPVMYYNPHGEDKKTLTEDRSGAILFASNPDELRVALAKAVSFGEELKSAMVDFLTTHCGPQDGQVVERCIVALSAIANGRIVASG